MEVAENGGSRLVVRNTFLELLDDTPALGPVESRRPRAMTDLTDSKDPHKVRPQDSGCSLVGMGEGSGISLDGLGGTLASVSEANPCLPIGAPAYMMPWGGCGYAVPPHGLPGAWDYAASAAAAAAAGAPPPYPPFPGAWPFSAGYPGGCSNGPMGMSAHGSGPSKSRDRKGNRVRVDDIGTDQNPLHVAPSYSLTGANGAVSRTMGGASTRGERMEGLRGRALQGASPSGSGPAPLVAADMAKATPFAAPARIAEEPLVVGENHTTVMLRNIPNRYTQTQMLKLLGDNDFGSRYDFVYLPMDFRNGVNLGYAFVNLSTHADAKRLMDIFHGFSSWFLDSNKVCEVSWAHPHQGLSEHVERYRNSPVMHASMPDEYKPMVFKDNERFPFPPPTKAIRAPKLRPVRERQVGETPLTG